MSGPPAEGTAPPGAAGEEEAARWVRGMFGRVARRYDFLNHLLSFNLDRRWRARTVRELRAALERPGARVLDLCCGTGDLLVTRGGLGIDFCHPMLLAARGKRPGAALVEADALALPLADRSFDVAATAFGFRNLANYEKALREIERVLKPGGVAAILEFSQPPSALFAALYRFYSRRILPAVGGALSGERGAYEYLPESVRKFPSADRLADMMREAGFVEVRFERLTGGIVALHLGTTACAAR
ncbi:MAG: class I SAM-dependent methyltransferase [Bryobacteraceae bacterium]|jgi:demethylmenaquinone methyltransferase / 2-methoxy-6-polyprenyl-1,4-benzoquinol methylase